MNQWINNIDPKELITHTDKHINTKLTTYKYKHLSLKTLSCMYVCLTMYVSMYVHYNK